MAHTKQKFLKQIEDCINDPWELSTNCYLSEEFIENNMTKIRWSSVLHWQKLSEDFLRKHFDTIIDQKCFTDLIAYQRLSEAFLEELMQLPDWKNNSNHCFKVISYRQKLSEAFIGRNKNDLCWERICQRQKLSSSFMENYIEYLDFNMVSRHQKLGAEFVSKNFDKLNCTMLLRNKSHSPELKKVLLKNAKKIVSAFF